MDQPEVSNSPPTSRVVFNWAVLNASVYSDQALWQVRHCVRLWNVQTCSRFSSGANHGTDRQRLLGPVGRNEVGVGLVVAPGVGVAAPVLAVVVEDLRFDPPPNLSAID